MQQIHNLQPPGRFLIEDKTGDHRISSNNGSSHSGDNAVHPLLLKKAWVQVENDKAIVKIMHRLREKDDKEPGTASSASGKKDSVNSDTSGEVETNAIKLEQPGEDFLQQNCSTTSGENESVGQYDDLFDDTEVVEQPGIELSHAVHEHMEKGENNEGQYDDLFFGDSEDKSVGGGQFDRFFDNTGSHQLTLGDNLAGQFDGLFSMRGENVEGGLHDGLIDADDANAPHTTLSHDHDVLFGRGADYASAAQGNTAPLQVQQHSMGVSWRKLRTRV